MRVLAHTQSVLYRRLGRTPPKPGPAREAPPRGRAEAAQYSQRLVVVVRNWYDHVETIARKELGARTDATFEEQLAEAFDKLVQASGIDAFLERKARAMANKQAAYLKRVTKLPPGQLATQQVIEQYRQENARLITGLKDAQVSKVTDVLRRAQSTGDRWEEVAPGIKHAAGVGIDRARLIARDQTNKFNGTMQRITQTSAGVDEYTWSTTKAASVRGYPGGPNTRAGGANHYALEGTRHKWSDPPVIPGTSERAHPGQQINCECVAIPVIPGFE
jgi:SPP1 gp7 family putative phage head morphogenesis protein